MKRAVSNAVVLILIAYALLSLVSAASAFWSPPGTMGLTTDYGSSVRFVRPGSPADLAGIREGDELRIDRTPFDQRRYVAGVGAPIEPGTELDLYVVHGADLRHVRLIAVPAPLATADAFTLFISCLASVIFIVVGGGLILIRPNVTTWGFGLFCLLGLPVDSFQMRIPDARWALASTFCFDIVQNIGVAGLVMFTLEFPHPLHVPWRRAVRRWLPLLAVFMMALTLYPDVKNLVFGQPAQTENVVLQFTFGAVYLLTIVILIDTYRRIALDDRERVRWVIVGFAVGLVTNYIGNTLFFTAVFFTHPAAWLVNALLSLNVLLPLAVAHAVVRHRVLDFDFVIGRALIFAVLTTLLTVVFGLLDWLSGRFLEDFRLSHVLAAGISICVALTFGRLERFTSDAVEAMFFRKRRAAEAHIERSIAALPHARTDAVVLTELTTDAGATLEITSAAVFRIDAGGTFARTESVGWDAANCAVLDDSDPLVLMMRSEMRLIDTEELPWRRSDVPHANGRPHSVFPLRSHAELAGFVMYGGHRDGGTLDPDELGLLDRLVTAAGLALDQIAARKLREDNEEQQRTIVDLRARLDELRR